MSQHLEEVRYTDLSSCRWCLQITTLHVMHDTGKAARVTDKPLSPGNEAHYTPYKLAPFQRLCKTRVHPDSGFQSHSVWHEQNVSQSWNTLSVRKESISSSSCEETFSPNIVTCEWRPTVMSTGCAVCRLLAGKNYHFPQQYLLCKKFLSGIHGQFFFLVLTVLSQDLGIYFILLMFLSMLMNISVMWIKC